MESGSRAQVLFFVIHVYFDASDDIKFDNLLLCIYVVCTIIITYFWIWRTLILKRKFDKIVAVAQELVRGYKGGGGEQCYLELHPMFLSAVVPELGVNLFHNGISLRHAVCIKQTELSYLCQYLRKNITPTITWCEFGRYEDWFKD